MVGRRIRIDCMKDKIKTHVLSRVTSNILDLQAAISEGEWLTKIFSDVVCPIFMLDGLTCFLSHDCLQSLFREMSHFQQSAVILGYWYKDVLFQSGVFRNSMQYWSREIPETVNTLFNDRLLGQSANVSFCSNYKVFFTGM